MVNFYFFAQCSSGIKITRVLMLSTVGLAGSVCGIPRILRGTPFSLCRSSPLLTSVSDPAHADNSIK